MNGPVAVLLTFTLWRDLAARTRAIYPFIGHGQLGVTHVGSSALLGPRQKEWIGFGGLSMEWLLTSHWALLAQFDSHSAILSSDLKALGEPAGMLSLGLRRSLGRHWAVDVSFAEDIVVESAPDIIFSSLSPLSALV